MKRLFFLFLLFLAVACSEDETPKKVSGYFKLAQVQSPSSARSAARMSEAAATSFDLGVIKASREFYFLLANGGENDITNVELTTNNPAFIISPASISLLPAAGSDSEALVPLVSLGIEHGPKLNGVGYTDLLPMGENTITLTITGSTVENNEMILLESTFTITVDVKTMDLTLYSNDEEINYSAFDSQASGFEFDSGLPNIPLYYVNHENFKVKNTGNVDITVSIVNWSSDNQTSEVELSPNETATITFPAPTTSDYIISLIRIDGGGTVTDRSRIKQGVDGKGYVVVEQLQPE